jgi:hypothetical protein
MSIIRISWAGYSKLHESEATQKSEPQTPTDFGWWYTFGWQAGHYALMSLDLSSEEDVKTWLEQNYNRKLNNPLVKACLN